MRKTLLCTLVLLCAAGCGTSSAPRISPLQRFDQMEPTFKRTGTLSADLALDLRRMNQVLEAESLGAIRKQTLHTARDARELEQTTGAAGVELQRLAHTTLPPHVGEYFALESYALSAEWWEGHWLVRLSSLLQKDPLATVGDDATLVRQLSAGAIRSANAARGWAELGTTWRKRYGRAFRYIPVGTPPAK